MPSVPLSAEPPREGPDAILFVEFEIDAVQCRVSDHPLEHEGRLTLRSRGGRNFHAHKLTGVRPRPQLVMSRWSLVGDLARRSLSDLRGG